MSDEFNKEATDLLHKNIQDALERIERQTTLTNGKVKRLYLFLTGVAAFTLGLGLVEAKTLLSILI